MVRKGSLSPGDAIETLVGASGAAILAAAFASAVARFVPGAITIQHLTQAFAIGAGFLLLSYLMTRSCAVLLGRAAQALLMTVLFVVLALAPALFRAPRNPVGWLIILAFCGAGFAVLRAAPKLRTAIEAELP